MLRLPCCAAEIMQPAAHRSRAAAAPNQHLAAPNQHLACTHRLPASCYLLVPAAEIMKRRIAGLHQNTAISSVELTDKWEPKVGAGCFVLVGG